MVADLAARQQDAVGDLLRPIKRNGYQAICPTELELGHDGHAHVAHQSQVAHAHVLHVLDDVCLKAVLERTLQLLDFGRGAGAVEKNKALVGQVVHPHDLASGQRVLGAHHANQRVTAQLDEVEARQIDARLRGRQQKVDLARLQQSKLFSHGAHVKREVNARVGFSVAPDDGRHEGLLVLGRTAANHKFLAVAVAKQARTQHRITHVGPNNLQRFIQIVPRRRE